MPIHTPPKGCSLQKTGAGFQILPSNERWVTRYVCKISCSICDIKYLEGLGLGIGVFIVRKNAFTTNANIWKNPHVCMYNRKKMACFQNTLNNICTCTGIQGRIAIFHFQDFTGGLLIFFTPFLLQFSLCALCMCCLCSHG